MTSTARMTSREAMDAAANRIPDAITALLAVRTNENLDLTSSAFTTEDNGRDGWTVTMHACKAGTGDDVQVSVILSGATGTRWVRRDWDDAAGEMVTVGA